MEDPEKATFMVWRFDRKLAEQSLVLGPTTTVQTMLQYYERDYPAGMTIWTGNGNELNPDSVLSGGNTYHVRANDRNPALRTNLEAVRRIYWEVIERGEKRKRDEGDSEGWHILVFPQATRVGQDGRFQKAESKNGYWVLQRESFGPLETTARKLLFDDRPVKDQYLLHGPAGTGKSHFIVALVNKLMREAHERAGKGGDPHRFRVIALLDCTLLQENFEETVLESLAIAFGDDDLAIDQLCQIETVKELANFIMLSKAVTLAVLDQYQVAESDEDLARKIKKLFFGKLQRVLYVTSAGSSQIKELVKSSHKYYQRLALPCALSKNDLLAWNLVLGTESVVTEQRHRERLELLGNNPLFLRKWYNVCRELGANVPSFDGVSEEALREALLKAKQLVMGTGVAELGEVGSQKRARLEEANSVDTIPGAAPAEGQLRLSDLSGGNASGGKQGPEGEPPGTVREHSLAEREVRKGPEQEPEQEQGARARGPEQEQEQEQGTVREAADAETQPNLAGQGVAGGVGTQTGVAQTSLRTRGAFAPSAGQEIPNLGSLQIPGVATPSTSTGPTAVPNCRSESSFNCPQTSNLSILRPPPVEEALFQDPDWTPSPIPSTRPPGSNRPSAAAERGNENPSSETEAETAVQARCPSFEECWKGYLESEVMNQVYIDLQDNLDRATADGVRKRYLDTQRLLLLKTGFVTVDFQYVNGKYFVFGEKVLTARAASDAVKLVIAQFLDDVSEGGRFFDSSDVMSAFSKELRSAQHPAVAGVLTERALLAKLCQGSGRSGFPVSLSNAAPRVVTFETGEEEFVAENLLAELEKSLALGRKEFRAVVKPKSVAYRLIDYVDFVAVWKDPGATTQQPARDLPGGSGQGSAEAKPSAVGGSKKKKKGGGTKAARQDVQDAPALGAGKAGKQRGKRALRLKDCKIYIIFGQVSLMKFEEHVFSSNIMHEVLALKWMASGVSREQVEFGMVYVLPEGRLPDAPERNCWKNELNRPLRSRTVVGMVPHRQVCLSFAQFDTELKEVDKWPERWSDLFR